MTGELVDARDARLYELEREIARLTLALSAARDESARAAHLQSSLVELRRQLSPLYRALQGVFGVLDEAVADAGAAPVATDARTRAVWDAWKARLGSGCAKVIDALLLHGDMNTQQLAIAVGLHRTTIPGIIYKLNQAGLLNKNGGRFSLKSLS